MAHRICGSQTAIDEEFTCSYELNPGYQPRFEASGVRITGRGPNGECRVVELAGHSFYLATLFLPQLSSSPGKPHPLIVAYLQAVLKVSSKSVQSLP